MKKVIEKVLQRITMVICGILCSGLFFTQILAQNLPAKTSLPRDVFSIVSGQIRNIKNAPFSAEVTSENTQTLADGNRIKTIGNSLIFRDAEGRFRIEERGDNKSATGIKLSPNETVTIFDPVAGFRYYLNPTAKIARREKINSGNKVIAGQAVISSAGRTTKEENLGTKKIEGVEADGKLITNSVLAGTIGNEKDLIGTNEIWYSKAIEQIVLQKRSDPRTGTYIYQLKNIKLDNLDQSVFTVPQDYQITETK